jgi:hypothetical protein
MTTTYRALGRTGGRMFRLDEHRRVASALSSLQSSAVACDS